ncbi:MAG: hypothetical protein IKT36_07435, partial [Methanocorpusculum sp.]|nr:hypothetical protein [Methanocorpusculum sp.]
MIFQNLKKWRPYKRINEKQTKQNAQTHFRKPLTRLAHGLVASLPHPDCLRELIEIKTETKKIKYKNKHRTVFKRKGDEPAFMNRLP